jgi:hypothetical protein
MTSSYDERIADLPRPYDTPGAKRGTGHKATTPTLLR